MAEPSDRGTARLVDVHHVAELTGFSAPTVRVKAKQEQDFPKPLRAGSRTLRWRESEVLAYIEGLVPASR